MINIIVNSFVCFCVYLQQYSSGLKQYDFSHFGGFKTHKVEKEIARGKKLVSVSLVTRRTLLFFFFLFLSFLFVCLLLPFPFFILFYLHLAFRLEQTPHRQKKDTHRQAKTDKVNRLHIKIMYAFRVPVQSVNIFTWQCPGRS